MRNEIFLDTAYAIAVITPSDDFHVQAVSLAYKLKAAGTRLITTQAILLEIGNAFSKHRYRQNTIDLLDSLEADPNIKIIQISKSLYLQAFQLFKERSDKEWGLTDCVSFVVMQQRRITQALTADKHFEQAGFQALLRGNYF